MKWLIVLLAGWSLVSANSLEVTADHFTHIEKERKAVFEGNAHAIEGKSRIDAKRFVVYFDDKNNATEYQAIGNVRFEIVRPEQHIKGSCDHLTYRVAEETYLLRGKARVKDLINGRLMQGEEIFLDNKNRKATAKSDRKGPVKFIFKMKEKPKKKKPRK